jgi:hypothetical protein
LKKQKGEEINNNNNNTDREVISIDSDDDDTDAEKKKKEPVVDLNPKQQEAIDAAKQGKNVFVTGPDVRAWFSTKSNYIIHAFTKNTNGSPLVLQEPALEGQTLHRFAGCGKPVKVADFLMYGNEIKKKNGANSTPYVLMKSHEFSGDFLDHLCHTRG